MKTITMYELLGLVKDGNAPKKIKYINSIWEYDEETKDYIHDDLWLIYSMNSIGLTEREVEIIEEEKKIPEKLEIEQDTPSSNYYIRNEYGTKCGLTKHSKMIVETLNEVIDYLDYLKNKGE